MHYFLQSKNDIVSGIPYGNNKSSAHYVQADDAKLYYELYVNGDPCLVLHGGGVGSPSTRGHGKSEIGTKKISYEQKANDMLAVVNDVTKDPITIIGFSDGGYTAYNIASMYPNRVKKIVAIDAGENIPGFRRIPLSKLEDFMKIDENYMKEKISLCPEPEKLQNYLDDYNERISKELFNSIQCPTLLIAGELDQNAPLDTVINAYKIIPKLQLAIIANAPHTVFLANFEAVWANIKPFLNLLVLNYTF